MRSVCTHACASGGAGGGLVCGSLRLSGRGFGFGFNESIRAALAESLSVESLAVFVESFLTESAFALSAFALSAFVIVSAFGSMIEPGTALTKSSIVTRSRARRIATTGSMDAIWMMLSASPSRVAELLAIASAGMAICRGRYTSFAALKSADPSTSFAALSFDILGPPQPARRMTRAKCPSRFGIRRGSSSGGSRRASRTSRRSCCE